MKQFLLLPVVLLMYSMATCSASPPDEGMWLVNKPSALRDAVVGLDEAGAEVGNFFCTAEVVSAEGLIFTNHHCGFSAIQSHSSLEHNYLKDGFWAFDRKDELPDMGLQASFLIRMENVTKLVLEDVNDSINEKDRDTKIATAISRLTKEAENDGEYKTNVKSFFGGNEYYLFVYRVYRDVRLVGTPAASIGEFGGETDNWIWPRHTGDFCIFRIYTDKEGNPVDYSPENIPLKAASHLPISLKAYQKYDETTILGYPGSTDRYLTSYGIKLELEQSNPVLIKLIGKKLDIWKKDMEKDKKVDIMYAAKYDEYANAWKNYIGVNKGIRKLNLINRKKKAESAFQTWTQQDPKTQIKYGEVLKNLDSAYSRIAKFTPGMYALSLGTLKSAEVLNFAKEFFTVYSILIDLGSNNKQIMEGNLMELREKSKVFFKDFNSATDLKVLAAMFELCRNELPSGYFTEVYQAIDNKYEGNYTEWAERLYKKSIFSSPQRVNSFLDNPKLKVLNKDPLMQLVTGVYLNMMDLADSFNTNLNNIDGLERKLMAGLMEMKPETQFYPDANSTMRISHGKVLDYFPSDAVQYNYYTTLEGLLAKEDTTNDEFIVPEKLKELCRTKDYGEYADGNEMRVCFLTNNDISGGNSGSPVVNSHGELIGLAFDGNWEAMSCDLAYEPELQRTICVDIRYVLFVIDKVANAQNLIHELTLR